MLARLLWVSFPDFKGSLFANALPASLTPSSRDGRAVVRGWTEGGGKAAPRDGALI